MLVPQPPRRDEEHSERIVAGLRPRPEAELGLEEGEALEPAAAAALRHNQWIRRRC